MNNPLLQTGSPGRLLVGLSPMQKLWETEASHVDSFPGRVMEDAKLIDGDEYALRRRARFRKDFFFVGFVLFFLVFLFFRPVMLGIMKSRGGFVFN